ncbi:MAG: glycosyltransferase family 4 protein [Alphaproteobacteria bacterium]
MPLDNGQFRLYQIARRAANAVANGRDDTGMSHTPLEHATVMVDLTPLLPGGGNGGAKWFVLALLSEMGERRAPWRWLLLTTAANDALLGERLPAMARLCVLDEHGQTLLRPDPAALPGGGRADLLYCPFTAPFYARPAVPTVATVYDLQFIEYPQFFSRAEVEERAVNFFRAAAVAERLVCISDYVRDHVCRATGLDESWVRRVHISLPDRLGPVDHAALPALLARHGLARRRYLIYPANTWPHKNHDMLLTAAGMYFARHPSSDLKIVCAGVSDDARGRALKAAARRMGLGERVIFPGFLAESELAGLLAAARALIFPSLFEGFGMPLLEAMAQGVPVLSANTTSLPEIAGDGALLFDPRRPGEILRAIETIEEEPQAAARLAEAGRARAAALGNAATMAEAYLGLFDDIIAEQRRLLGPLRRRLRLVCREVSRALAGGVRDFARKICLRLYARIRRAPTWLWGRVQLARVFLGGRLPQLRALARRLRRALSGAKS